MVSTLLEDSKLHIATGLETAVREYALATIRTMGASGRQYEVPTRYSASSDSVSQAQFQCRNMAVDCGISGS